MLIFLKKDEVSIKNFLEYNKSTIGGSDSNNEYYYINNSIIKSFYLPIEKLAAGSNKENNNCLFLALKNLGVNFLIDEIRIMRKIINNKNKLIKIEEVETIANYLEIKIKIIDIFGNKIKEYGNGKLYTIHTRTLFEKV